MRNSWESTRTSVRMSVLGQTRTYSDDAALERVWGRLENRRRRPSMRPVMLLAGAAALLGVGVFVGMGIERMGDTGLTQGASEISATAESPAGSIFESTGPTRAPTRVDQLSRRSKKKAKSKRKVRHAKGLSAQVAEMHDEDFPADELTELMMAEPAPPPIKPAWLSFAERGDFAAAFSHLDEAGGFDAVVNSASPEELMTLVDVARYVGRQGRAIQALRSITEHHQTDPNAPLAAMMLGNLLSRAGDAPGALEAFALNRRLSPEGDFAEDALVREFDMAVSAGDVAAVNRLRAQYEQEFPDGSHLAEMLSEEKGLAANLAESLASSSDAAGEELDSRSEEGIDPPSSTKSGADVSRSVVDSSPE